ARSIFDRIHPVRRERRMAGLAMHGDAERALALVADHHAHFGRLAHEAGRRLHLRAFKPRDHAAHADAADLFVVGDREVGLGAIAARPGTLTRSARMLIAKRSYISWRRACRVLR